MIKRLTVFILLLLFALSLMACSSARSGTKDDGNAKNVSGSIEEQTISLAHGGALDSHLHEGALKFKELVEEQTDGKVEIQIHPNSELGAEREMAESMLNGSIDMTILSTGPLGNFADKINALDFPFLFEDHEHAEEVLDGEVGEEIAEQLEETGMNLLYWVDNGSYHIATNKKPIHELADLKGLKLRTQENQIQIDTINALGASATPIAFSELFLAAQQGIVDGQGNSLAVLIPQKYYEVHKYLTITNHMYSAGGILINDDKFDSLSEDLQKIIKDAAVEAGTYERQFVQDKNVEYLEIAEDEGMEIIEDMDLEPLKEAVEPVYEKYVDKYGEIHDKIRNEN